nr:nucleotide disphospho-sugar-binding domain-containing protein [Phytoactinopolyspora halophila]
MASAGLDALLDLAKKWPPDVVVGGSMTYVAGLLATHLNVPYVRQSSDIVPTTDHDIGAEEELRPELKRLGLDGLPVPALFLDVCPPSLKSSYALDAQPMRWISGNRQRRLEPWMYTRPEGRRRVLITSGTRSLMLNTSGGSMRYLVDQLAMAGAEVLIAAPGEAADEFGTDLSDVHIGWIPLDVVAPTCDLAVNHGGGATVMTILSAGVPQLIIPESVRAQAIAQTLSSVGATMEPQQQGVDPKSAEAIAAGSREILSKPQYARQARALANEVATLPTPSEVVRTLTTLAPV